MVNFRKSTKNQLMGDCQFWYFCSDAAQYCNIFQLKNDKPTLGPREHTSTIQYWSSLLVDDSLWKGLIPCPNPHLSKQSGNAPHTVRGTPRANNVKPAGVCGKSSMFCGFPIQTSSSSSCATKDNDDDVVGSRDVVPRERWSMSGLCRFVDRRPSLLRVWPPSQEYQSVESLMRVGRRFWDVVRNFI